MSKTISTDAVINGIRLAEQSGSPVAPASGYFQLYARDDGKLYGKNDAGTDNSFCLDASLTSHTSKSGSDVHNLGSISMQSASAVAITGGNITGTMLLAELSGSPTTPASGYFQVYAKNDGKLYGENDSGAEYGLSNSGKLIYSSTVGSGSAVSLDISSISQEYDYLEAIALVRGNSTGEYLSMKFNADTTDANYRYLRSYFSNYTHGANADNYPIIGQINISTDQANAFSVINITIPFYNNSATLKSAKSICSLYNTANDTIQTILFTEFWESTQPINQITFSLSSGNFVENSKLILIGHKYI
jgi:hypothetical protein